MSLDLSLFRFSDGRFLFALYRHDCLRCEAVSYGPTFYSPEVPLHPDGACPRTGNPSIGNVSPIEHGPDWHGWRTANITPRCAGCGIVVSRCACKVTVLPDDVTAEQVELIRAWLRHEPPTAPDELARYAHTLDPTNTSQRKEP